MTRQGRPQATIQAPIPQNPLGRVTDARYAPGSWPVALRKRVAGWVRRLEVPRGRTLDLGCGEGPLAGATRGWCLGVDLNRDRITRASAQGLPTCVADAGRLPVENGSFTVVVSMEMLEHVPDMIPVMREVRRVLVEGGHWIISVPSVTLRSWYEMNRDGRCYYCDENEHYREFTPVRVPVSPSRFERIQTFESRLREQGFDVRHRDGVRFLLPQWFNRVPALGAALDSPHLDRLLACVPMLRRFPYWSIRVVQTRLSPPERQEKRAWRQT